MHTSVHAEGHAPFFQDFLAASWMPKSAIAHLPVECGSCLLDGSF